MKNVYTVGQVNRYIKNMFDQDFMLNRIYVKGEVSNCKYHPKGHIYFSLKDESGTISCILFAGSRGGIAFRMQDGQQVVVSGTVTTYERDGKYQLYAKEIILDGAGLLAQRFQELKEELEEMGMFDAGYKRPVPMYAQRIGIVTAPTGAAIRDIIHIAKRRNPYVQLIISPALVQGEGAKESIVKAIKRLEMQDVDVIIVGRGGGSMEDLWAFNEEEVARAIFECPIPVISAVGHETDTTIADYVADLRAPTPSAAAELSVYPYHDIQKKIDETRTSCRHLMVQRIQMERLRLRQREEVFRRLHPGTILASQRQRAANLEEAIRRSMKEALKHAREELRVRIQTIEAMSPMKKLNQGYAFATDEKGRSVRSIKLIKKGDRITLYVTDGVIHTTVEGTEETNDGIK